jgi:Spy/CpxP family protein refolding chaperone
MQRRLAGLCVTAAMSAWFAWAQPMRRGGAAGDPPDPAAMITMRVNMLTARLNLTDAQKTQAISIFTSAHTAAAPVQTSIQARRDELSAAVKSSNIGLIESEAQALGTLQGQLTAIESKAEAAFYAVLTADQRKLYDAMPRGAGMGMGRGGPGSMRRGGVPPR